MKATERIPVPVHGSRIEICLLLKELASNIFAINLAIFADVKNCPLFFLFRTNASSNYTFLKLYLTKRLSKTTSKFVVKV